MGNTVPVCSAPLVVAKLPFWPLAVTYPPGLNICGNLEMHSDLKRPLSLFSVSSRQPPRALL